MSYGRYSLYGSEEEEDTEMDMSGFLGAQPYDQPQSSQEKPKVTPRPRGGGSDTPYPPNVGYTIRNPIHVEPDDEPLYYTLSPFYSHDDALGGKAVAWTKLAGMTSMGVSGMYAIGAKLESPIANKAFWVSSAVYLHPTLGWNHGLMRSIKGDSLVTKIGAGTGKLIIHGAGAVLFYKLLTR
jgi:hypothetical protein